MKLRKRSINKNKTPSQINFNGALGSAISLIPKHIFI